jgi:hypothetical protein
VVGFSSVARGPVCFCRNAQIHIRTPPGRLVTDNLPGGSHPVTGDCFSGEFTAFSSSCQLASCLLFHKRSQKEAIE